MFRRSLEVSKGLLEPSFGTKLHMLTTTTVTSQDLHGHFLRTPSFSRGIMRVFETSFSISDRINWGPQHGLRFVVLLSMVEFFVCPLGIHVHTSLRSYAPFFLAVLQVRVIHGTDFELGHTFASAWRRIWCNRGCTSIWPRSIDRSVCIDLLSLNMLPIL